MSEIHDTHQTEHQRQTERGKSIERPGDQAIGEKLEKEIHISASKAEASGDASAVSFNVRSCCWQQRWERP